ncbi:MAG: AtpZ/AtpI family protein [Actinobacteria bacterium]|nr:AtpZ/AtpI family protein [Actinomycetota bacterium]
MDIESRRELNNGFGDSLSRAFEFAATPALFSGVGYFIDRIFDTQPFFMIVLLVWASVSQVLLWWYRYDAQMAKIEADLVDKRDAGLGAAGVGSGNRISTAAAVATGVPVADGRLPSGITLDTDISALMASLSDASQAEAKIGSSGTEVQQ